MDNIILYGPGSPMIKNKKNNLKSDFEVMDLGDLDWHLGIQIKFEPNNIELSQIAYIDSILSGIDL
jgi:hypothetical protein